MTPPPLTCMNLATMVLRFRWMGPGGTTSNTCAPSRASLQVHEHLAGTNVQWTLCIPVQADGPSHLVASAEVRHRAAAEWCAAESRARPQASSGNLGVRPCCNVMIQRMVRVDGV